MKNVAWPLLLILTILPTLTAVSQERKPVLNITEARWEDYAHEYRESPLCSKQEITLWSCRTRDGVSSLCSSRVVNRTSGYIQYRESAGGKLVFTFPGAKAPPLGIFTYSSSANGDASLAFSASRYEYTIIDPLRSRSSINVSAFHSSRPKTEIACRGGNQTLQVNYTMRLMYDAGVWDDYGPLPASLTR